MASLSHLSSEVVAQILRFLAPIDILSMRKTCRQCYSVTKFKTVWMAALDEVCERHGIFKATYPMDEMSHRELEHAAMSPRLFVKSIKENSARGTVPPHRSHSLKDPSSHPASDVNSLFLVPGGRFLITAGNSKLCLWDLGCSTLSLREPYPLATLRGRYFQLYPAVPSLDQKELIVAVRHESRSEFEGVVDILRVNPQSPNPVFRVEGRLNIGSNLGGIVYLTHNTAFINHFDCLLVWNWAERTGLKWTFGSPLRNRFDSLYVSDTLIASVGSDMGRLLTWKAPSPSALKPLLENVEEMDTAHFEPSYVQQVVHGVELSLCATSIWQRDPPLSQEYLCLLSGGNYNINEQNPGISLLSLGEAPVQNEPLVPTERGRSKVHYGGNINLGVHLAGLSLLFKCEDHLVFCSGSNSQKLVATVMAAPRDTDTSHHNLELQSANLTGGKEGWQENLHFGFCPMSGRLVHPGRDKGLRIDDYLVAPNESL